MKKKLYFIVTTLNGYVIERIKLANYIMKKSQLMRLSTNYIAKTLFQRILENLIMLMMLQEM